MQIVTKYLLEIVTILFILLAFSVNIGRTEDKGSSYQQYRKDKDAKEREKEVKEILKAVEEHQEEEKIKSKEIERLRKALEKELERHRK